MPVDNRAILQQIDQTLADWRAFRSGAKWDDCSDKPEQEAVAIVNQLASTIERLGPSGRHHERSLHSILKERGNSYAAIPPLVGALAALRKDYDRGYLQTVEELVHADTFVNFIEMAESLHAQGYKDAAAVIAGTVLEQHLRGLAKRNNVAVESNGKHKTADALNSELAGQGQYNKLDQKSVTSWLGLRNDAAHGNYYGYTKEQVRLMIDGVQNFMARYPA